MRKVLLLAAALLALPTLVHAQAANCRVTTSAPTYANGTTAPLSCETDGDLRVNTSAGGGGTQYDIGDAAGATDTGTVELLLRDDALSSLSDAEGDWVPARVDANGAQWITGTVDLGATDNGVLDSIDGNTDGIEALLGTIDADTGAILADTAAMDTNLATVAGAVSGTEMQVDIVADGAGLALDSSVDGIEALLTTIDADTSALAGAVSGSEVQADIASAIPAGTNNIGDVDVVSTVDPSGVIRCTDSVVISAASSGNTQLVALSGGEDIYICSYNFIAETAVGVRLVHGTGTACATGETGISGIYPLGANGGISVVSPVWFGLAHATGEALCIELDDDVQVSGVVTYVQQ